MGLYKNPVHEVKIGLVGKYLELQDAYKSIFESFVHAGVSNECKVDIVPIHSEQITEENVSRLLKGVKGILVAPGFGDRGINGKVTAIKYARENNLPFFGICLGMQCAVVEFAQNVLQLPDVASTEMDPETPHPVIDLMEDQKNVQTKGGTMRLGAYTCRLEKGTKAQAIYKSSKITERHRHRYEFNNDYKEH